MIKRVAKSSLGFEINSKIIFDLGVFSFLSESVSDGFKEKKADSEPDISAAKNSNAKTRSR
jgi:hypothetical protein